MGSEKRRLAPIETRKHGYGCYTNGCRCEVCRAAKAEYIRARRATARQRMREVADLGLLHVEGITHGRFGYEERGCRCVTCLAARAAADHDTKVRRKGNRVQVAGEGTQQ